LVGGCAVIEVAVVKQAHGGIIPLQRQSAGLFDKSLSDIFGHLEEGECTRVGGHHKIADMLGEAVDKEKRVEATVAYLLVEQKGFGSVTLGK
ncbi:hypothetical protein Q0L85_13785, partial [Staphylococcus aureus]|nr:hypothetical protein [Staphylococcus aureus]